MLCWRARFAWRCTCALSNCTPACFLMGRMFLTRQAGLVGMKLRRFQTNVKSPKVQVGFGGEFLLNNIAWLEMPSVVWNYQNTMCMHSCCAQCYPWCVAVMNWRKLRRLCGVGATTHTPLHCDNAASLFYQAVSLTTQIIYSGAFCCHVLCVRLNVFHLFNIVFLMQILDFWRPFVDAPFTCHLQLTPTHAGAQACIDARPWICNSKQSRLRGTPKDKEERRKDMPQREAMVTRGGTPGTVKDRYGHPPSNPTAYSCDDSLMYWMQGRRWRGARGTTTRAPSLNSVMAHVQRDNKQDLLLEWLHKDNDAWCF